MNDCHLLVCRGWYTVHVVGVFINVIMALSAFGILHRFDGGQRGLFAVSW